MGTARWMVTLSPDGGARLVSRHIADAFARVQSGRGLKVFDALRYQRAYSGMLKQPTDDLVMDLHNQSLAVQVLDFGATHLLVPALSPVTLFTLNLLRKNNVKTIHWFFEDYARAEYWRDVLPGYCYFCAIQKGPLPDACSRAGARYLFLPPAAAEATGPATGRTVEKSADVAFIGIPSSYRIRVLEYLAKNGLTLAIGGLGWNSYRGLLDKSIVCREWVEAAAAQALMQSCRVGLNLSVRDPAHDRANTHVSPRVYDLLAAGLVLVTEDVPLALDSLAGAHFHTFTDERDAFVKIRAALDALPSELLHATPNRELVSTCHTYDARLRTLFAVVE